MIDDSRPIVDGRASEDLSVTSAFAVVRHAAGPMTLTASARHDDPDRFRSKTTGRLSAAFDLGHGFVATASAGQGFKIPTISQVVCDFCFAPPVPLRPERAEGYDLRVGWSNEQVGASLTAYRLLVRDQIAYVASRYINIAKTSSSGLEAEVDGFSRAVRKGFVTADVSGAYEVSEGLSLTARIENLTDRRYAEVLGYREPGLAAYVGVRFRN